MDYAHSIQLQAEVDAPRAEIFRLVATAEGLSAWLDAVEMEPRVGSEIRVRMADAIAVGKILSVQPPQHISFTWDWEGDPLGTATVVAFDAIDHGERTHLTMRQVGFRTRDQKETHEGLWTYWFGRLEELVRQEAGGRRREHAS